MEEREGTNGKEELGQAHDEDDDHGHPGEFADVEVHQVEEYIESGKW